MRNTKWEPTLIRSNSVAVGHWYETHTCTRIPLNLVFFGMKAKCLEASLGKQFWANERGEPTATLNVIFHVVWCLMSLR